MSNPLLRTFGRTSFRALYSVVFGVALVLWGMSRGWPWWVAVPAGILVAATVFMALVSALYAYTKLSYPARAEAIRAKTNPRRGQPATLEPQDASATQAPLQTPCAQDQSGKPRSGDADGPKPRLGTG